MALHCSVALSLGLITGCFRSDEDRPPGSVLLVCVGSSEANCPKTEPCLRKSSQRHSPARGPSSASWWRPPGSAQRGCQAERSRPVGQSGTQVPPPIPPTPFLQVGDSVDPPGANAARAGPRPATEGT